MYGERGWGTQIWSNAREWIWTNTTGGGDPLI